MRKHSWTRPLVGLVILSNIALGDRLIPIIGLVPDCQDYQGVIDKCLTYSHALEDENTLLKQSLQDSRKETATATAAYSKAASEEALVPWYVYVLGGAALGYLSGRILK